MASSRGKIARSASLVLVGLLAGAILMEPVGAHLGSFKHLKKKHFLRTKRAKSIQLPAQAAFLEGNATFDTGNSFDSGIILPDSGGSFAWNFMLPRFFKLGATPRVRVYWLTTNTSGCTFNLTPNFMSVARPGLVAFGANSSVSPPQTIAVGATAGKVSLTQFTIGPIVTGRQLKAGDSITLEFIRDTGSPGDTCANPPIRIHGADVRW